MNPNLNHSKNTFVPDDIASLLPEDTTGSERLDIGSDSFCRTRGFSLAYKLRLRTLISNLCCKSERFRGSGLYSPIIRLVLLGSILGPPAQP